MEFKASFARIVGTPQEGRDSWVYVEDGFFLSLELCGPAEFPVALRGKEIIDNLVAGYHQLPTKNLTNVKELASGLKLKEGVSLSLVLGVQVGRALYLICRGAGRVIARREGKFGIILSEDGCASGILKDKDIFLLTSAKFSEVVPFDEVKNVFDNLSVSELAESLAPLVHRADDTSGVAALIIQFKEMVEDWSEEAEEKKEPVETPAKQNFLSGFSRLKPLLSYPLSLFQRSQAVYLKTPQSEEQKKKRITFGVVTILAILLGVSVVLGVGKKIAGSRQSRFNQVYDLSLHQYEEGKALLGLNNLRAQTLFNDAKTSLATLSKDLPPKSAEADKLNQLLTQIEQGLGEAGQIYKVTPEVFLDLNLVKEGAQGKNLTLAGEEIVVCDNKNSSLYQINIKQKSSEILAGGENLAGAGLLSAGENQIYVLGDKGVLAVGLKTKSPSLVIKKDSDWGEVKALAAFSGNLYLLNASQIWKYAGGESGFLEKKNYFSEGTKLTNPTSLSIDGAVWVATDKIMKFTQGKVEDFSIQGLDKPLTNNLLIFTQEDAKNLYILDKNSKRVVVLEKTGSFKSQYVFEAPAEIQDMAVSENNGKILLLSGNKIYQIELK